MAIYRLEARIIGRTKGGSAYVGRTSVVRMAAYRAGETLRDGQGKTHDFSHRTDIEAAFLLAPDGAPDWARDRAALWNRVEDTEKRKDAQLAREVLLTLPRELTPLQRRALVTRYVQERFVSQGMIADIGIHNPPASDGGEQPHAHVLLTTRRLAGEGFEATKARDWNDVAFRQHPEHGQLAKAREGGVLHAWRQAWQEHVNRALADAGSGARVDCRSLQDRRIDRAPQPKLGIAAHARNELPHLVQRRHHYALVNHRNQIRAQTRALEKLRIGKRLPAGQHVGRALSAAPSMEIEPAQRRRRLGLAVDRGRGIDP